MRMRGRNKRKISSFSDFQEELSKKNLFCRSIEICLKIRSNFVYKYQFFNCVSKAWTRDFVIRILSHYSTRDFVRTPLRRHFLISETLIIQGFQKSSKCDFLPVLRYLGTVSCKSAPIFPVFWKTKYYFCTIKTNCLLIRWSL